MIMQTEVVGREFKKHFVRGLRDIEKLDLLCEVYVIFMFQVQWLYQLYIT